MRICIYRIHYGLDFLKQSILSVKDTVDKIFVIYSLNPWVVKDTVTFLNRTIQMPLLHEDVQQFMYNNFGSNQKIEYFRHETNTPLNQFRLYYDLCVEKLKVIPDTVLFMEPDMVFYKPSLETLYKELQYRPELPCIGTTQIELWKTYQYRIPQRDRIGPMLWAPKRLPEFTTHFGTWSPNYKIVSNAIQNYNFGFCLNPVTMFYKHLTAINFSEVIGDSIPSHEWYRDKWLNWKPETTDLEIAEKWKHLIPKADIYNMPSEMLKQMEL